MCLDKTLAIFRRGMPKWILKKHGDLLYMHITTAKHGFTRPVLTMVPALSNVRIACVLSQFPNNILSFASGDAYLTDEVCIISSVYVRRVTYVLGNRSGEVVVFQAVRRLFHGSLFIQFAMNDKHPAPFLFRMMALKITDNQPSVPMTTFDNIRW